MKKTPWNQVKEDLKAFNDTTYTCVYMIANMANLIYPFMPKAANRIKTMLNLSSFKWEEEKIHGDIKINNTDLLFTRIETK
jgi:methionyl-tRNA synthetase